MTGKLGKYTWAVDAAGWTTVWVGPKENHETLCDGFVKGEPEEAILSVITYDITTFDPERQFESPDEAIEYANRQPDPLEAAKAIILSNIEVGEYGFASEVTSLLDTM